jgi:hypothetical protein
MSISLRELALDKRADRGCRPRVTFAPVYGRSSNRSLETVEPVSPPRKRKLEKSGQPNLRERGRKLARSGVSWHLKVIVCIFPNFAAAEKVENSLTRPLELRFEVADGSAEGQGRNSTDGFPVVVHRDLCA